MHAERDPAERDFRRLEEAGGLLDLRAWTVLRLGGADVASFLQGIATQDLADLGPGRARRTLFLTEKGRPVALAWVALDAGGAAGAVIADEGARPLLRQHLERFLVMEDVEIFGPDATPSLLGIAGPDRATLLEAAAARIPGSSPLGSNPLSFLLAPEGAAVQAAGDFVAAEAAEAWRLAVGLPRTGTDFDLDRIATELSVPEAISMTKGCYVGQEVVARTSNRGQARRRRVGFRFPWGGAPLPARSEIRSGATTVGFVTSSARVPGAPEGIGMGYLSTDPDADSGPLRVALGGGSAGIRITPWLA